MEDNDEFDLDSNGPENSLLPQPPPTTFNFTQRNFAMTRLGTMRAHWLGAIICIGGFLCKLLEESWWLNSERR